MCVGRSQSASVNGFTASVLEVTNSACGEDDAVDWAKQVVKRVNPIIPRAGSSSHYISTSSASNYATSSSVTLGSDAALAAYY